MKPENFYKALEKLTDVTRDQFDARLTNAKCFTHKYARDVFRSAFTWGDTEEGHNYWWEQAKKLQGITNEVVEGWKEELPLRELIIGPFESGEQATAVRDKLLEMGETCFRETGPYKNIYFKSLIFSGGWWKAGFVKPNTTPEQFFARFGGVYSYEPSNEPEQLHTPAGTWTCGCSMLQGHTCGKKDAVVADKSAGVWGYSQGQT